MGLPLPQKFRVCDDDMETSWGSVANAEVKGGWQISEPQGDDF